MCSAASTYQCYPLDVHMEPTYSPISSPLGEYTIRLHDQKANLYVHFVWFCLHCASQIGVHSEKCNFIPGACWMVFFLLAHKLLLLSSWKIQKTHTIFRALRVTSACQRPNTKYQCLVQNITHSHQLLGVVFGPLVTE